MDLVYRPHEKSWNAIKLSSFQEGFYIVYIPKGEEVKINPLQPREEGLALIKEQTDCYHMKGILAEADE